MKLKKFLNDSLIEPEVLLPTHDALPTNVDTVIPTEA